MKKLLVLGLLSSLLILSGCFFSKVVQNNNTQSGVIEQNTTGSTSTGNIEDNSGSLDISDSGSTTNEENNTISGDESDSGSTTNEENPDDISNENIDSNYSNTEYGFQFTMPSEWTDVVGDYKTVEGKLESGDSPYIAFTAKTTDENWLNNQVSGFLPEGYAELFRIGIIKKSDWIKSLKTCDKGKEPCLSDSPVLGEKGTSIFVVWLGQEGPSDFTMFNTDKMKTENPVVLIKKGFSIVN